jgi:signal transduction histidine kinase
MKITGDAEGMAPRWWTALRARLPRGIVLPEPEWRRRHRIIVVVLAAHIPGLLVFGLFTGVNRWAVAGVTAVVAIAGAGATVRGSRGRRALCATGGLLLCSTALVLFSGGVMEAHLHFFAATVLVSLYERWLPLLSMLFFVAVEHAIGVVEYPKMYGMDHGTGRAALIAATHAAFLLAMAATLMVFWSYTERTHRRVEQYRSQLLDAEMGAIARLREANQIREDLIGSVSHEFRTPLTAIRGAATTLRRASDRIRPEDRAKLLDGIVSHGERLSRLLEDMLSAASASAADPAAVADVSRAVMEIRGRMPRELPLTLTVEPRLAAYIERHSLHQLVGALADHLRDHARQDQPVTIGAVRDGAHVQVMLIYASSGDDTDDPARLLEPFGSREGARTGRSGTVSLYVVRRLAEVHGGTVTVASSGRSITLTVRLRALRTPGSRKAARRAPDLRADLPITGPTGAADIPDTDGEPVPDETPEPARNE